MPDADEIGLLSRSPHLQLGDGTARDGDELIRLACMNYGADSPSRPAAARALWRSNPSLASVSVFAAAAAGDHAAVAEFVSMDQTAASRWGGPFDWPPLLYATYSRLVIDNHDFVETVRMLLAHGADPNCGFLWDGLLSPFTAVTGAIGRGEQGSPAHTNQLELLELLLDAGADPNDGQAVYNISIGNGRPSDDVDWLELLYAYGFGDPTSGPWYQRFGDRLAEPGALVAELLHDAARRGFVNRVRLLLDRGADPNRPGDHPVFRGHTPHQDAIERGYPEIASLLVAAGARSATVDTTARLIGRLLAGERVSPTDADAARKHTPDLIRVACELAKPLSTIRQLAELGWDVNHKNRATALHEAALLGSLETVQMLVALGANPTIVDDGFNATPSGWAAHFGHTKIQHYLESRGD